MMILKHAFDKTCLRVTMSETPMLLKVDEAAELLRVSPATVRRMIVDGRVRAVSLGEPGSSVRIPRAELVRPLGLAGVPAAGQVAGVAWATSIGSGRGVS
jgi:excisionase family DNA binding protein